MSEPQEQQQEVPLRVDNTTTVANSQFDILTKQLNAQQELIQKLMIEIQSMKTTQQQKNIQQPLTQQLQQLPVQVFTQEDEQRTGCQRNDIIFPAPGEIVPGDNVQCRPFWKRLINKKNASGSTISNFQYWCLNCNSNSWVMKKSFVSHDCNAKRRAKSIKEMKEINPLPRTKKPGRPKTTFDVKEKTGDVLVMRPAKKSKKEMEKEKVTNNNLCFCV